MKAVRQIHKWTERQERNFWKKVNKEGPPHPYRTELGNCWVWTAGKSDGYGITSQGKKTLPAHRVYFFQLNPEVSQEFLVCHSCDNPSCVNPWHLWPGTEADNKLDSVSKKRHAFGDRVGSRARPETCARGIRNGRYTKPEMSPRGERHGMHKLTSNQVREIRAKYVRGSKSSGLSAIAAIYGLDKTNVSMIVNGKTWKHIL